MFNLLRSYKQVISLVNHTTASIKVIEPFWDHQRASLQCLSTKFCSSSAQEENETLTLSEEEIHSVANGDEEQIHKLKVLLLETAIMHQEGKLVPSQSAMKLQNWKELLELETRSKRRKYLEFLFKLEKTKDNKAVRKARKREELLANREPLDEGAICYYLGHNNMFLRIYDTTIMNFYNSRLIRAIEFGQKIVIDCGYEAQMTRMEISNCAKQLMLTFADNRSHDDPFDLHFCNLQANSAMGRILHRMIPTMYDPVFPMNIHSRSYLDLFPNANIVYLTPHCREELHEYDHDAVYIIGAMVDKVNNEPLSLAKAKREGLKMAKLPLDTYLTWGAGSGKSLTINQVMSIMLDIKMQNDWKFALRHVPRRKLAAESEDHLNQPAARRSNFSNNPSQWKPSAKRDTNELRQNQRLVHLKHILNE